MSFRELLGIGGDDQSQQTCDWCGKKGVSIWWTGRKGRYCSFRCNAAGSYRGIILVTVCIITLESIISLIEIMMFLKYPNMNPFVPVLIVPQALITLIMLSFVYSVYVGRSLRKEREASELAAKTNERSGGPDAISSSWDSP